MDLDCGFWFICVIWSVLKLKNSLKSKIWFETKIDTH
jgi:hypothetical protein